MTQTPNQPTNQYSSTVLNYATTILERSRKFSICL